MRLPYPTASPPHSTHSGWFDTVIGMTNRVRLLAATPEHFAAYGRSPDELAEMLGSPLPQGWPEFPEAFDFTSKRLAEHPDESDWWMYFFLDAATGHLLGSGGYTGPPADRQVEIGYEIAPEHRGRGLGAAAARALVDRAFASGLVDAVIAHTLPGPNPSTGVLTSLGFGRDGEIEDPHEGTVWQWRLNRA
jgi:RimJ/RimL family protein N-acetyltransferase